MVKLVRTLIGLAPNGGGVYWWCFDYVGGCDGLFLGVRDGSACVFRVFVINYPLG